MQSQTFYMEKTIEKEDVRLRISQYLTDKGIKRTWLADKIGISDVHFHFILKGERDLLDENLKKINEALGTKFKN